MGFLSVLFSLFFNSPRLCKLSRIGEDIAREFDLEGHIAALYRPPDFQSGGLLPFALPAFPSQTYLLLLHRNACQVGLKFIAHKGNLSLPFTPAAAGVGRVEING